MLVVSLLLSLAQAVTPPLVSPPAAAPARPAFSSRRGGKLFISPMGEPFRPKARDDDTLADWFLGANKSRTGKLTLEEMQADAERFFATLDLNHDGEIDPDELSHYETVVAPEVQTVTHYSLAELEDKPNDSESSDQNAGRGGHGGHGGGGGHRRGGNGGDESGSHGFFHNSSPDTHQGAARYGLLDLPEPVISADTDFDRGVSLAEFRAAAQQRFLALDLDHKGYLTLDGLEAIHPAPPPKPNPPQASSDSN